jgi:hypothetical protein
MTQRMYLLAAYRAGFAAAQSWKNGTAIRCPYFCAQKWMAWHAGFDRGLYVSLHRPSCAEPTEPGSA